VTSRPDGGPVAVGIDDDLVVERRQPILDPDTNEWIVGSQLGNEAADRLDEGRAVTLRDPDETGLDIADVPVVATPLPVSSVQGGVERVGEAVVRQILGARFVREEPYESPTRFQ